MMLLIQAHSVNTYNTRVEIDEDEYNELLRQFHEYHENPSGNEDVKWHIFEDYLWDHCEAVREAVLDQGPDYEDELELWHMEVEKPPMYLEKGYKG